MGAKKRSIGVVALWLILSATTAIAQTQVIAHRGYWRCEGSAQNSIASLQHCVNTNVYGSEFDIVITRDGVIVVNHDNDINGIDIQRSDYSHIENQQLSNGEKLPTLEEYLTEGSRHPEIKLIVELKPHRTRRAEHQAVNETLRLVEKCGVESQVEFISFSRYICRELASKSKLPVSYLGGKASPSKVARWGVYGIDYHYKVFERRTKWIAQAKECGIATNAWTVNSPDVASSLIEQGIDFVTTDYPEEIAALIESTK